VGAQIEARDRRMGDAHCLGLLLDDARHGIYKTVSTGFSNRLSSLPSIL